MCIFVLVLTTFLLNFVLRVNLLEADFLPISPRRRQSLLCGENKCIGKLIIIILVVLRGDLFEDTGTHLALAGPARALAFMMLNGLMGSG